MRKKCSLLLSLVGASVVTLASSPAQATLMRAMDLPELVAAADRIVVADVVSVQAAWDGPRRSIHTTVEIDVRESWKGHPTQAGRITVRQLGGAVGELEMTVKGSAKFAVGERAVLFLRRANVVGMAQGKRNLRWEKTGRRWLATPADCTSTIRIRARGQLQPAEPEREEALDSLRKRVQDLVGKP